MSIEEKYVAKKMAKALAFMCLNEHFKESLHNGDTPITKAGDFSDVLITDAEGHQFVWQQACRVSYAEREEMVAEVANGIYDFLVNIETEDFSEKLEEAYKASAHWTDPKLKKKRKKKV